MLTTRSKIHLLMQLVLGLGCLVLFWLAVALADRDPGWRNPQVLALSGTSVALAWGIPYLGSRFVEGVAPRWTALAFSGWFLGAAGMTAGSIFEEGNQWTVFAFWFPVALAVCGLAWVGSRLGVRRGSRGLKQP